MLATVQSSTAAAYRPTTVASKAHPAKTMQPVKPVKPFQTYQPSQHALAQKLNAFLLQQIGEQTQNYEQQFEALLNGEETCESLEWTQRNAIKWADLLNKEALISDLEAYEAVAKQPGVQAEAACCASQNAESHRMALAESLVERVRLAYLFVYANDIALAEETINDASHVDVPQQALEVRRVSEIFDGVRILSDILKLAREPYCMSLLFNECDRDSDGRITRADLTSARRRAYEVPTGVLQFLEDRFEMICGPNADAITCNALRTYMRTEWVYSAFKQLIC